MNTSPEEVREAVTQERLHVEALEKNLLQRAEAPSQDHEEAHLQDLSREIVVEQQLRETYREQTLLHRAEENLVTQGEG